MRLSIRTQWAKIAWGISWFDVCVYPVLCESPVESHTWHTAQISTWTPWSNLSLTPISHFCLPQLNYCLLDSHSRLSLYRLFLLILNLSELSSAIEIVHLPTVGNRMFYKNLPGWLIQANWKTRPKWCFASAVKLQRYLWLWDVDVLSNAIRPFLQNERTGPHCDQIIVLEKKVLV